MNNKAQIRALPSDRLDDFNGLIYVINSVISNKVNTIELVKVVAVNGSKVDVIPALDEVDVNGDRVPSSQISSVNVFRSQAGENAFIINPEVGDIGLLLVCKHDISNFPAGVVIDGSEFNYGDGVYLGGVFGFNKTPTNYVKLDSSGITITSPANITINATGVSSEINIEAATTVNLNASSVQVNGNEVAVDGDKVVSGTTVIGTIDTSQRGQE